MKAPSLIIYKNFDRLFLLASVVFLVVLLLLDLLDSVVILWRYRR